MIQVVEKPGVIVDTKEEYVYKIGEYSQLVDELKVLKECHAKCDNPNERVRETVLKRGKRIRLILLPNDQKLVLKLINSNTELFKYLREVSR